MNEISWRADLFGAVAEIKYTNREKARSLFVKRVCATCSNLTKCAAENFKEVKIVPPSYAYLKYSLQCLSYHSVGGGDEKK